VDLGSVFFSFSLSSGIGILRHMLTHHGATMQRPWRSLHSLRALVIVVFARASVFVRGWASVVSEPGRDGAPGADRRTS